MDSITQDMKFRLSLIKYADKYGVTKAAIKYKTNRQYIYCWKRRFDGSLESLRDRSRRPHHHPNQKQNLMAVKPPNPKYIPKPYEQMTYPRQRVQVDVKHVPPVCLVGDVRAITIQQNTA